MRGGLVAHLVVIVITGTFVILVIVLLVVHRVCVDLVPVDLLAARATATGDDIFLGDGLEIAAVILILVCVRRKLVWRESIRSMNLLVIGHGMCGGKLNRGAGFVPFSG